MDKYHKKIWINHSLSSLGVETSPEPIFSYAGAGLAGGYWGGEAGAFFGERLEDKVNNIL